MIDNLNHIRDMIDRHGQGEVTLIAVTKYQTIEDTNAIIELGVKDIGESRAQDLEQKLPDLSTEARIHFIGHLQRNKVKDIIRHVTMIHSVDSFRLARQIDRLARENELVMDILVQVNIAHEDAKWGFDEDELDQVLQAIAELPNVRIQGLMMMAPMVEDPEDVRGYFRKMKELFDYYADLNYNNVYMKYLSMGMTNDYKIALEEGSNMIRIGTALFQ